MSIAKVSNVNHYQTLHVRRPGHTRVESHRIKLYSRTESGAITTHYKTVSEVKAGPSITLTINVLA